MSKRYFFEISYHGKPYYGWQRQPKQRSVQEVIENCLSSLYSKQPIQIVGCGRTDTGVHAKQYFFHVDLDEITNIAHFIFKLNRMLPESIAVQSIVECSLHARFDAKARTYRYFIHQQKNVFVADQSCYIPQELNIQKMNEAASYLIGTQDFTSFSKLHTDVKTNMCTVYKARWEKCADDQCYFEISADRFLRNMVRATVGTLLDVGRGKLDPKDLHVILGKKDRGEASVSAPAHGLFLWEIVY